MTKTRQSRMTKLGVLAAIMMLIALSAIGALVFQDNISRFAINPRTPIQTISQPAEPDYGNGDSWLLHPAFDNPFDHPGDQAADIFADIFYVHDTTYGSPKGWNGPIDDAEALQALTEIALPNELGPFLPLGDAYAPHYRQATLFARFTHKYDGLAAYELAYDDVRAAFAHYLKQADPENPLILVGYGQGALMIAGLINEFVQPDEILRRRIAAAYLIDQGIVTNEFGASDEPMMICTGPMQTECVISYTAITAGLEKNLTEARRRTTSWGAQMSLNSISAPDLICVNPLDWRQNSGPVGREFHKGAASATGLLLDQAPALIRKAVGASCVAGILEVDRPEKAFLRKKRWFGQQWRNQPFNLFYADLREDARRRLLLHQPILAERVRQLAPIERSVDLSDSPINKVPD